MRIWSIWDILYVCCVQSSPCICVRCARRHRRRWLSRVSVDRSVGVCMCKCWVSVPLFFVCNLPLARFTCLFVIKLTLNLISSALSNFCFPKTDAASMIWYFFFLLCFVFLCCLIQFYSVPSFSSVIFLWLRFVFVWFVTVGSGDVQYYTGACLDCCAPFDRIIRMARTKINWEINILLIILFGI